MKSAFHSVGLPDVPILALIDRVADAGYRGIELNAETLPWAGPHVTPDTPPQERRTIRATCAARGLAIPAIGAHVEMVGESAEARQAAIRFVEGCIDLASDLACPFVHVLSGPQASGASYDASWRWFADAVARCASHADSRGVGLGVEAIAGHLFHATDDYHRLFHDLPGSTIFVNFDPSHLEVQGENPARVPDELGDRIRHVHLKDGKGRFPDFAFPPLGQGTIDFHDLAGRLRTAGFKGFASVEYEAQVYGYALDEDTILKGGEAFCNSLEIDR